MKSLKQVYTSIYKKYQLKEVYNNLFELRDAKSLRHNIKGRNTNVDLFSKTQEVSVPGVGTFQLNKFQTALVGLVIEFYFGNKIIVKNLLKNISLFIESSVEEEEISLDENKINKFLDYCVLHNILDENYSLIEQSSKKVFGNKYNTSQSFGYLFEIFTAKKVKEEGYNTNYDDFLKKASGHLSCKYVFAILDLIYLKNKKQEPDEIKNLFNTDLTEMRINSLTEKVNFQEIYLVKNLIDENIEENKDKLYFEFDYKGNMQDRAIDIVVKYNDIVVSLLDLKCSETLITTDHKKEKTKAKLNSERAVSSNKYKVKEQIASIVNENSHTDFSVGILRITHNFNVSEILIVKSDCLYISYNDNNDTIMKRDTDSYRLTVDDNCIIANEIYKPIKQNFESHVFDFYNFNKENVVNFAKESIEYAILNPVKSERSSVAKQNLSDRIKTNANKELNKYDYYLLNKQISSIKNEDDKSDIDIAKEEIRNHVFVIVKDKVEKEILSKEQLEEIDKRVLILYDYAVKLFEEVDQKNYTGSYINTPIFIKEFKEDKTPLFNEKVHKYKTSIAKKILSKCEGTPDEIYKARRNDEKAILSKIVDKDYSEGNYYFDFIEKYFDSEKDQSDARQLIKDFIFTKVKEKAKSSGDPSIISKYDYAVSKFEKADQTSYHEHYINPSIFAEEYHEGKSELFNNIVNNTIKVIVNNILNDTDNKDDNARKNLRNTISRDTRKNSYINKVNENLPDNEKDIARELIRDFIFIHVKKEVEKSNSLWKKFKYDFTVEKFEKADQTSYHEHYLTGIHAIYIIRYLLNNKINTFVKNSIESTIFRTKDIIREYNYFKHLKSMINKNDAKKNKYRFYLKAAIEKYNKTSSVDRNFTQIQIDEEVDTAAAIIRSFIFNEMKALVLERGEDLRKRGYNYLVELIEEHETKNYSRYKIK